MIIDIVDKWNWGQDLIGANCPNHLLKVAFVIADNVHKVCTLGKCISKVGQQCDRVGWAYPTVEQICEATGLKPNRVSECTGELHKSGWIFKEVVPRTNGRKAFYKLLNGRQWEVKGKTITPAQTAGLKRGNSVQAEVQPRCSGSANPVNEEVATPLGTEKKHLPQTLTKTETETITMTITTDDDQRSAGNALPLDSSAGEQVSENDLWNLDNADERESELANPVNSEVVKQAPVVCSDNRYAYQAREYPAPKELLPSEYRWNGLTLRPVEPKRPTAVGANW